LLRTAVRIASGRLLTSRQSCSTLFGGGELVVDQQLLERTCVEPPWLRPVRNDVARLGHLRTRGARVLSDPRSNGTAGRVVVVGHVEVHRSRVWPSRFASTEAGPAERTTRLSTIAVRIAKNAPVSSGRGGTVGRLAR
jgi:hypothetical protein